MNVLIRAVGALLVAGGLCASSTAADSKHCSKVPRERFTAFIEQVRPQPVFRNGGIVGYRIYERSDGKKLAAIGLQQGDLITHFCGLPMSEVFPGEGSLCCARPIGEVVLLDIEREGQSMRVKASIPPKP